MTKTIPIRAFAALLLTTLLILLTCSSGNDIIYSARAQATQKDTIPKYRYYIKLDLTAAEFYRINFISDSLMEKWGAERGGSEIERAKTLYYFHQNYWRGRATLDSVKVK